MVFAQHISNLNSYTKVGSQLPVHSLNNLTTTVSPKRGYTLPVNISKFQLIDSQTNILMPWLTITPADCALMNAPIKSIEAYKLSKQTVTDSILIAHSDCTTCPQNRLCQGTNISAIVCITRELQNKVEQQ